jgi:deazaflavin-dependent oxidoreductase (nitroreductase family)
MATAFRPPWFIKLGNALTTLLLRRGVGMATNVLLTVPGRKSGLPRTTPVTIIHHEGARYVQSPFGDVDWVRNLRAAGSATLTRGSQVETVSATELSPDEAAPILRRVLEMAPALIQKYYDVTAESSLDELVREAPRHPMFRLAAAGSAASTSAA